MNRFFLTTAILGVNMAVVHSVAHAESKSAQEINDIAAGMTVQILGERNQVEERNQVGERTVGSGILLQQEGNVFTVLTAAHVLDKGNFFEIKTPDGATHRSLPQSIRLARNKIDLAVVKFRSDKSYDLAKLPSPSYSYIQGGQIVYVAGFPLATPTIPSGPLNFTVGNIISDKNSDGSRVFVGLQ
jgi:S1-C subfamily serine protease